MWTPDRSKLVKICLHDDGEDVETPWAEDLGPIDIADGARRVRIANIPYLHEKPTYEDVIVVVPDEDHPDRRLTWNRKGTAYEDIGKRISEDSGRWLMIIDYALASG